MRNGMDSTVERGRAKWGAKFDPSGLAPQFYAFHGTGTRIRVRFSYGEEVTGTVGVTTGWRPSFLLMRRSSDTGSSCLLGANDRIVAIKRGRKYVAVAE